MKYSILIIALIALISCANNKEETITIKVVDNSTYSYNNQEAPPTDNINNSSISASKTWLKPVDATIKNNFNTDTNMVVFDTKESMAVVAINDGTVVYSSDKLKSFGSMIIVKHNFGFYSHYMFNQDLLVKVGEKINQGQVIAKTSQQPFALQMKKYTTIINPQLYIK